MAHIKYEELYGVCGCCYGAPYSEECDFDASWCKEGDPENCGEYQPKIRFAERSYKQFTAEEHFSVFDYLDGYWDLTAGGKTRVCSYLEIDGRVYCDKRELKEGE